MSKIGSKFARAKPNFKATKRQRALPQEFYSKGHVHGCARCNARVENCSCASPDEDPLCSLCRHGRDLPWWPDDTLPKDCCRVDSRRMRKEEKTQFLLAGTREWWKCEVCGRKHPHDPRDPDDDPPTDVDEWQMRFPGEPLPHFVWPHEGAWR